MLAVKEQRGAVELQVSGTLWPEVNVSKRWGRVVSRARRVHVHRGWDVSKRSKTSDVVFVSSVGTLQESVELKASREISADRKRFLLISNNETGEALSELLPRLAVRDERRLYVVTRSRQPDISRFLSRFVEVLDREDEDQAIVDAFWDADGLVIVSQLFERLHVPLKSIPQIREATDADRESFQIDDHGDYVYWPSHDIHMGWPQFLQAVDPQAKLRAEQKSEAFNEAYGAAIRRLREETGLKQSDIAGLDERTVRRIETGRARATTSALGALAKTHGLSPVDYMNQLAKLLGNVP